MTQTITFPPIEAGEVVGPTGFATSHHISFPVIDRGVFVAPTLRQANPPLIEALVNGTVSAGTFARKFDDVLGDTGSFSYRMRRGDYQRKVTDGVTTNSGATITSASAEFTADDIGRHIYGTHIPTGATIATVNSPTSIEISSLATGSGTAQTLKIRAADFDDIVTIKVRGVARFPGVVENIDHTVYSPDEGHLVEISGRGAAALLDLPKVVYPSRGLRALPIEDVRTLSWVGADFDPAAAGWKPPKKVNRQSSYADTDAPRPAIWADTTGWWIGPNLASVTSFDAPQGITLYRKSITLAATKNTKHFIAGDNVTRFWIDGAEMTWFAGSAVGRLIEIELGADTHILAAKVANKVDVPGEDNPTGLIGVGYTLTADGLLDEKIWETDTSWYHLPYPVRAPGFTVGKAERLLLDEGGLLDNGWSLDFTDLKTTDGKPWTYQREISVNVGRSLLEVQRELSDTHADIAVAPGSQPDRFILRAWNHGERGRTRPVTLQQTDDPETSDFISLRHRGQRTRQNTLLIRSRDGHTEAEDTDSRGAYGDRGGYIELGHLPEEEAEDAGLAILENRKAPAWSTPARLKQRTGGAVPFDDFEVGDRIDVTNEWDEVGQMRILSLGAEENDGELEYPITFRNRQLEEEERHRVWLRRMADGVLIGGARVSSRAATPAPTAQQISVLQVAEFSHDNVQITTGAWPKRPAAESGNIVQVYGQLTTAGSTGTAIDVILNGVHLTTLSFAAGATEAVKPVAAVPVHANVDKLWIDCDAAGTGAEGLVVQIRAI